MLKGSDYEDVIEEYAPKFDLFFSQLRLLLSDNTEPLDDKTTFPITDFSLHADTPSFFPDNLLSVVTTSALETKKRPNSLTITTSSPTKLRLASSEHHDAPQTPYQPTIPMNPAFSGTSIESTDEDNTKWMIGTLIDTALLILRSDFIRIPWPTYAQKCRLRSAGYFP